jgi:L-histidine N-alpha-methyltransferase
MNLALVSETGRMAPVGVVSQTAAAALTGLTAVPRYLPSWLFYDAAGSRLFEAITELPEYYLTRTERDIFHAHADAMIAAAASDCEDVAVLELGAGSASKTIVLLKALAARQSSALYLPIDVSEAALRMAARNVRSAVPTVRVEPICADITHAERLQLPNTGRRLALYIGSSIGNFDPDEAVELLCWLRAQLQPGDALLLGTDMVKDEASLHAAYNDSAGVTEAFNKNMLIRLNRELGAEFAVDQFEHRALWNPERSRMEMHLFSKKRQLIRIAALDRGFTFATGESIHTENSYKFTPESVGAMLSRSGFALERSWYDAAEWFGVHLARVTEAMAEPAEDGAAA